MLDEFLTNMLDLTTMWPFDGLPTVEIEERARNLEGARYIGPEESLVELICSDAEVVRKRGTTHAEIAIALAKIVVIATKEIQKIRARDEWFVYRALDSVTFEYRVWLEGVAESVGRRLGKLYGGDEVPQATTLLAEGYSFQLCNPIAFKEDHCPWGCGSGLGGRGILHLKDLTDEEQREMHSAMEFCEPRDWYEPGRQFCVPVSGIMPHLIGVHGFFGGREIPYRPDPEFLIKALKLGK